MLLSGFAYDDVRNFMSNDFYGKENRLKSYAIAIKAIKVDQELYIVNLLNFRTLILIFQLVPPSMMDN